VLCDANHTAGTCGDSPFFIAHHSGFALLQSYEPSCHFVFVAKQLKYAKDILHQILQGGKGQTGNGSPM
jgi:hypothetical protein